MPEPHYIPLWHLVINRIRLFLREPAAVFWVYGFPLLMLISLGAAFRDNPQESITVDIVDVNGGAKLREVLSEDKRFKIVDSKPDDWPKRLQYAKTDLVIEVDSNNPTAHYRFWEEPRRAESRLAHFAVESAILASEKSPYSRPEVKQLQAAGSRYIDFLLPGMLGMGLMGGGLWGVGFVVVDMRVRKLLKRFLATPMRHRDFLMSIMISRITFSLIDVVFLMIVGYALFGVQSQGNWLELVIAILIGAVSFAGIGLLVASRAQTLETVSGLMNLIILPQWVFSGIFFSSERFPETMQPVINLLPLTNLNQMLRAIVLEGTSMMSLWRQLLILVIYAVTTFTIALRIFRWK
jgi:ABC-type multidrug transport system permease subunit